LGFTQLEDLGVLKRVEKERSITDLGKFDLDDFDSHEDAFLNLLAQSFGVMREPLRYIVCPEAVPAEFATTRKSGCTNSR
jgi:hypothetical protein